MLNKINPFVSMFVKLRRDEIVATLEALHPLLREELRIQEQIAQGTGHIINERSRWTAQFTVSNYGSGPLVLFADHAELWLGGNYIRRVWIPSHLAYRAEVGAWVPHSGVFLIPSGATHEYQLVTNRIQSELINGRELWQIWESGNESGQIRLKILGRQLPWRKFARSERLPFRKPA
jgi:hypothetical protein